MLVLGIETTCDETAVAIVRDGIEILSNIISSQIGIHQKFKGVYPELAAREHVELFLPTVEKALLEAKVTLEQIDLIAVAKGPGLIGPLLIGLNGAKALAFALKKPLIGINHVEAHLYAAMMANQKFVFPSLGVVVSGGHTFLTKITAIGCYTVIGTTVDDAVGEAFDKVAALLDLPYPGGPAIEALAKQGNASRYPYKPGKVKGKPLAFSFSGLKTNVLYSIKGQNKSKDSATTIAPEEKKHIAASFQETALRDIALKAQQAAKSFPCQAIYVGGGVSHNQRLKELMQGDLPVYWPTASLSMDNGAMIAGLGYHAYKGTSDSLSLEAQAKIPLI